VPSRLPTSPAAIAWAAGALAFLLRAPFLFRYDLHFAGDAATCYLMALRITQGDRPLYFYGQDYQGALEAYVTAALFWLFGPSIPLAGAVSLLEWSLAVVCGTYLAVRGAGKAAGSLAGLVAAVGVPCTLHYVTVPYWGYPSGLLLTMLLPLQAFFLLKRGPAPARSFLFGLALGLGWFTAKQCAPGVGAALLALALLRSPAWSLRGALRPAPLAAALLGALVGYSPELWYRLHHEHRSFSGLAGPLTVWANVKALACALPAYFDGQPIARAPEATYFFSHYDPGQVWPAGPADVLAWGGAFAVVLYAGWRLVRAYRDSDPPLFLLGAVLAVNLAAVVVSSATDGDYLGARRYLYSSAVALSLWAGLLLAAVAGRGPWWWRGGALVLGALFLGRVAYHEAELLRAPDELRELSWAARDMREHGLDRGLAHFGYAYVINSLTDEQVIVASSDLERVPAYAAAAAAAGRLAVLERRYEPLRQKFSFEGSTYRLDGPPREAETFRWAPYRKVPK
jgi:hypothetical protein